MNKEQRAQQLEQWAKQQLGTSDYRWSMVSGDASFRRYFRLQTEKQSYICVDAPPEYENNQQFVKVAKLLEKLNAPKVLAADFEQGFMLLTDLGDQLLLPLLEGSDSAQVDRLYKSAIDSIILMQKIPAESLPAYDHALLMMEMELFRDWFVGRHLKLELSEQEQQMLSDTFEVLSQSAQAQPQLFVHRDYHSRNIMLVDGLPKGLIDFQDAVKGPVSYDLLSLVRDCYVEWPQQQVDSWVEYYRQAANQTLNLSLYKAEFVQSLDWMGLQRHIKVAGIFARLNYRDGKSGYLKDLPLTLKYIVRQVEPYPQLQAFHQFMTKRIMPAMEALNS